MIEPRCRQASFNAASRDQWDGFAPHRERVSALLCEAAPGHGGRLGVLGAGNTNDLDLPRLLGSFREVHLVDLDPTALAAGAERQGVAGHPGLHLHGGLDVTGMLDAIAGWSLMTAIGPSELSALAEWPAARVAMALPGPFDHVASTCLLTQLLATLHDAIGGDPTQFRTALRAMRAGHLRLLARLAGPLGLATLITDVTSTDLFPPLARTADAELASLFPVLAERRAQIHGVHPAEILRALREDGGPVFRPADVRTTAPWRWRLHAREYLVWALSFRVEIPGRMA